MVIAKAASRNVAFKFKATKSLGESIFACRSEILMPEDVATTSSFTHEEDLDDLGRNADLYAFNDETFEGCSSSQEFLQREQEQETYPSWFQSLCVD